MTSPGMGTGTESGTGSSRATRTRSAPTPTGMTGIVTGIALTVSVSGTPRMAGVLSRPPSPCLQTPL